MTENFLIAIWHRSGLRRDCRLVGGPTSIARRLFDLRESSSKSARRRSTKPAPWRWSKFRVSNPADYPFVVRKVAVAMEDSAATSPRATISELDARQLFQRFRCWGQEFNDTLLIAGFHPAAQFLTAVGPPV